jgi:allantoinase
MYDCVVTGGFVVLQGQEPFRCAIGIRDGRIVSLAEHIDPREGKEVVDANGMVVLPGGVDCHLHLGIYRPLEQDVASETESSLVGGATTVISYFRTGKHYLGRSGPYREILPLVLQATKGRAHTDFGYHLAPMESQQLAEIDWLVGDAGVASFKYYMFYKGLNLAGDSTDASAYTMSDGYDFGHLYSLMESVSQADQRYGTRGRISISLHCENAELIKLFMQRVADSSLPPLHRYSQARPPLSERLAIHEAGVLAQAARVRINLLHLSSREALTAARQVRELYPELDVRLETTLHHLALTYEALEGKGLGGKVNPPLRTPGDVEALWEGIFCGDIQWVASDHACCLETLKGEDVWHAQPGFGGTALLYPLLISEGYHRRGLQLAKLADLASTAPAKAFGCYPQKGAIALGADADLTIVDLEKEQTITSDLLHSAQDHTPFHGVRLKGWPVRTILRGKTVFQHGEIVGPPTGIFLHRPLHRSSESVAAPSKQGKRHNSALGNP